MNPLDPDSLFDPRGRVSREGDEFEDEDAESGDVEFEDDEGEDSEGAPDEGELEETYRVGPEVIFKWRDPPLPTVAQVVAAAAVVEALDPRPDVSDAWLSAKRMTRAECSLRLGILLVKRGLVGSDVPVALIGAEITKQHRPRFPVEDFIAAHRGAKAAPDSFDWRDTYTIEGARHALVLHGEKRTPRMFATLPSGGRLIVETVGGPVGKTRSSLEHKLLRGAIGRAVTLEHVLPSDVVAVAMPRSARTRQLATQFRSAPVIIRTGLQIFLVDRQGAVEGMQALDGS